MGSTGLTGSGGGAVPFIQKGLPQDPQELVAAHVGHASPARLFADSPPFSHLHCWLRACAPPTDPSFGQKQECDNEDDCGDPERDTTPAATSSDGPAPGQQLLHPSVARWQPDRASPARIDMLLPGPPRSCQRSPRHQLQLAGRAATQPHGTARG